MFFNSKMIVRAHLIYQHKIYLPWWSLVRKYMCIRETEKKTIANIMQKRAI